MRAVLTVLGVGLCAVVVGCGEPECRKEDPLSLVERKVHEDLDDRLDDWDATAEQRRRIHALGDQLLKPVGALRVKVNPKVYELVAALRAPTPDRVRIGGLVSDIVELYAGYLHEQVPTLMAGHALLTPEQRHEAAEPYTKPSELFDGSWFLDRGIEFLLAQLDTTAEQRATAWRIRDALIRGLKVFTRRVDGVRLAFAHEFVKPAPDPAQFHRMIDRGAEHTRRFVFDVVGYYLYFGEQLGPQRRQKLDRQLVRLEPCRNAVGKPN